MVLCTGIGTGKALIGQPFNKPVVEEDIGTFALAAASAVARTRCGEGVNLIDAGTCAKGALYPTPSCCKFDCI